MAEIMACYNILPEPIIKRRQIEDLKFESEIYAEGELTDTKVFYKDQLICWIEGNKVEEFAKNFYRVIKKYAI